MRGSKFICSKSFGKISFFLTTHPVPSWCRWDVSTAKTSVNTHNVVERLKRNIILIMVSEIGYQQKIFCLPDVLLCENMPFSRWELKNTLSKQVRNNWEVTDSSDWNVQVFSPSMLWNRTTFFFVWNSNASAVKILPPMLWWYTLKQNTDSTPFVRKLSWESSTKEKVDYGMDQNQFFFFITITLFVQAIKISTTIFHMRQRMNATP